ncbi:MAG TPA: hypothetical protein VFM38_14965 [Candidatus Limnocylindrales bacterium]|nr:hypothetical protein [Candidatus Limnocylindrales bacterium]
MTGARPSPPPIPPGRVVLHVGPHKTGTTSVQSAFHLARRSAAAQGVHYAGPDRHAVVAVQAAIEPAKARPAALRRWRRLVREMRSAARAGQRVVLSSEWLADAKPEAIERIVGEVGGDGDEPGVHVVVTVRSLDRVLPSQWQQYVAAGFEVDYETWVRRVLDDPSGGPTPTFWHRHRHDELVHRWAAAVRRPRVMAVVVDDRDHKAVLRSFEWLVGLRHGTLVAEESRSNRSLTVPEAEQVRAINRRLNAEVPSPPLRLNLGLYGATAALRARIPAADEPRLRTPSWARRRVGEIERQIAAGLHESGATIVGDIDELVSPAEDERDRPQVGTAPCPSDVEVAVAVTSAVGVLTAAGLARGRRPDSQAQPTRQALEPLSTVRLTRVVVGRVRSVGRGWSRLIRGLLRLRDDPRPAARELTDDERTILRAFEARTAAEGLPPHIARSVISEGVMPEMLGRDRSSESPAIPEIGASVAMGVVRAAGLLPRKPGGRRRPPPLATVETPEVARVSTPAIALEVVRRHLARVAVRATGRGR